MEVCRHEAVAHEDKKDPNCIHEAKKSRYSALWTRFGSYFVMEWYANKNGKNFTIREKERMKIC